MPGRNERCKGRKEGRKEKEVEKTNFEVFWGDCYAPSHQ